MGGVPGRSDRATLPPGPTAPCGRGVTCATIASAAPRDGRRAPAARPRRPGEAVPIRNHTRCDSSTGPSTPLWTACGDGPGRDGVRRRGRRGRAGGARPPPGSAAAGTGERGAQPWASTRSCTCTCTPSTRCSTAPPASTTSSPPWPPTAPRRSASPTTATCTASSTSTPRPARRGITPIIGTEGYFVTTSRFDRPRRDEHEIHHITLLAETTQGYKNLIKVSSHAYLDGFYYKPRLDFELLERHREGLIATTGCLGGAVARPCSGATTPSP